MGKFTGMVVGRRAQLDEAIARVREGGTIVVIAEKPDGTAGELVGEVSGDLEVHGRLTCAEVCWADVGGVAEQLALDDFEGGALIVEEAQWADPTSLGRLQRLVKEGAPGLLLLLVHRPLSEVDGWWLEQLAATAEMHADLLRLRLDSDAVVGQPLADLDGDSTDFVIATQLLTGAFPVTAAAHLLETTDAEILAIGDRLSDLGLVRQARGGFLSEPGLSIDIVGDARVGYVAGRLADAMSEDGASAAIVGGLHAAAGNHEKAFPVLAEAAREADRRHASGEAFHLAESALGSGDSANIDDPGTRGDLHLICGRFLRSAGRTQWAGEHLERASGLLSGEQRVNALKMAATVADDGQRPQDAERIGAMAELEAWRSAGWQAWGSLLTFRGRVLNRVGFAEEADASLAKGREVLTRNGDSPAELFQADQDRAWVYFDRGEAGRAATEFTRLRDRAEELEGPASVADKEAWRARALFLAGYPDEAIEAMARAEEMASTEDVEAPLFLAQIALAEGGLTFGRYEESLRAADRVLDLVERQLPAWENMARSLRATALLRLGRLDEARGEIDRALEATPEGANGWRWRSRCRSLAMEIAARQGEPWPSEEAAELVDLMLHSRFYGWAAELLCVTAELGARESAAEESAALAVHAGQPMIAARAATAASLWGEPLLHPVIGSLRRIGQNIPAEWSSDWEALPHVQDALSAPEPHSDAEDVQAVAALEEALERAGLNEDAKVLSPAQRRARRLEGGRRPNRYLRLAAAALGIVVLAGGTAFGVSQLSQSEPATVQTSVPEAAVETTSPEPTSVEDTQLPIPDDFFFGAMEYRGGPERTGYVDVRGPRTVDGYYWKLETVGPVNASPVAWGRYVYAGTTEGTFYAIDQTTGDEVWTLAPEGRISTAPAFGEADDGEGSAEVVMVVVDDDGIVRGHTAAGGGGAGWSAQLGGRVRSTPIVAGGVVHVATTEGLVLGLDAVNGEELWRHPSDGSRLGSVSADLSLSNGVLYVGTDDGVLHLLDVTADAPVALCEFDALAPIAVHPVVVDDIVYVATRGQNIWVLPAGECSGTVPERLPFYVTETPVEVAPAVVGDIMYLPDGRFLYAKDLAANVDHWRPDTVSATRPISAAPVVTQDAVYFGSEDGIIYAVDATTGEQLWTWDTGLPVRGSPAVVDGVAFVVSGQGNITAVGG